MHTYVLGYLLRSFSHVSVGVIGITSQNTPTLITRKQQTCGRHLITFYPAAKIDSLILVFMPSPEPFLSYYPMGRLNCSFCKDDAHHYNLRTHLFLSKKEASPGPSIPCLLWAMVMMLGMIYYTWRRLKGNGSMVEINDWPFSLAFQSTMCTWHLASKLEPPMYTLHGLIRER